VNLSAKESNNKVRFFFSTDKNVCFLFFSVLGSFFYREIGVVQVSVITSRDIVEFIRKRSPLAFQCGKMYF